MDSELHRIKQETGTVCQTSKGGNYYFRYQINGERKCISLKTANQEEPVRRTLELLPTILVGDVQNVKVARKSAARTCSLPVSRIRKNHAGHPEQALPATERKQFSHEATREEFLRFPGPGITMFSQITKAHVIKFAGHLRHTQNAVSTHNRKIVHLRKIVATLQEYREDGNPFSLKVLMRKEREEQDTAVRRLAFSAEREDQLRAVLDDPRFHLINKEESKVGAAAQGLCTAAVTEFSHIFQSCRVEHFLRDAEGCFEF